MEFDSRRYVPPSPAFPEFYSPLQPSQSTRATPRGYPIGGPVGGIYGPANVGREEAPVEVGSSRRRIAVACARCRKRKIRCSGDPGNGAGCTSCVMAGIDPSQCQFHRVGSDHLHKVIDGINMAHSLTNMASSNSGVPMYSNGGGVNYQRSIPGHQYPHDNARPACPSNWTVPYSEDTSPVENFPPDHSAMYLPDPNLMANQNMYAQTYRWNHPIQRHSSHESNAYVDQEPSFPAHGLPYMQPSYRPTVATDGHSPLSNMATLQMTLPERPIIRQSQGHGSVPPQRLLPIPQPSPAQTSRVSFDLEHDQRLRSGHAMGAGTSAMDGKSSFMRPSLPWSSEPESHANTMTPVSIPSTNETGMRYLPTKTSVPSNTNGISVAPHMQLNFKTSGHLDPTSATITTSTYSNFREFRTSKASPAEMARQDSHNGFYSFDSDHSPERNSICSGSSSTEGTLVSGLPYQPLPPTPSQDSPDGKKSFQDEARSQFSPAHQGSMNNLNSGF